MKYELTSESIKLFGRTLYRIRSLKKFMNVEIGDLGGFIEKVENLSQSGLSWVYGNARVSGDARIEKQSQFITITNLQYNITFTKNHIQIGCQMLTKQQWLQVDKVTAIEMGLYPENYDTFMSLIKTLSGVTSE